MKKKDKIRVELSDKYCCMSYDDIVANYNQVENYLKNNKISEYIDKFSADLMHSYKELFIQKLMLHSNISKSDFSIYVKVKKELERIKAEADNELKSITKEYSNYIGDIWK